MFHYGLCAAVNLPRPGHLKICCTDETASGTNNGAINVCISVDVMLFTKENIVFLNILRQNKYYTARELLRVSF